MINVDEKCGQKYGFSRDGCLVRGRGGGGGHPRVLRTPRSSLRIHLVRRCRGVEEKCGKCVTFWSTAVGACLDLSTSAVI